MATSPGSVQRFLSVRDLSKAKKSIFVFVFGVIFIKSCSCFIGLIMYATYSDCDPVSVGLVKKMDQMVAYFVMDVTRDFPGLPGLFVAGIFAASLSTLSSVLNASAGCLYEDILRERLPNKTEQQASSIMKWLVVGLGLVNLGFIFVVEKLGSILTVSVQFESIFLGPVLGMFTMGMVFKRGNAKVGGKLNYLCVKDVKFSSSFQGVVWGSIVSIILVGSMVVGSHLNKLTHQWLPMNTDNCEFGHVNETMISGNRRKEEDPEDIPWFFRISFLYVCVISTFIFAVVAVPVSLYTRDPEDRSFEQMDQRLLAPFRRDNQLYEKQIQKREGNSLQLKMLIEREGRGSEQVISN